MFHEARIRAEMETYLGTYVGEGCLLSNQVDEENARVRRVSQASDASSFL